MQAKKAVFSMPDTNPSESDFDEAEHEAMIAACDAWSRKRPEASADVQRFIQTERNGFFKGWESAKQSLAAESSEDRLGGVDEREWRLIHTDDYALGPMTQVEGPDLETLPSELSVVPKARAQKAERERDEWRKDAEDFSAIDALKAERARVEAAERERDAWILNSEAGKEGPSALQREADLKEAAEVELRRLRQLLNNAWLVVNDPANSFLSAEPWSREVEEELGSIRGGMRTARKVGDRRLAAEKAEADLKEALDFIQREAMTENGECPYEPAAVLLRKHGRLS
jgi:hypothetical protein